MVVRGLIRATLGVAANALRSRDRNYNRSSKG